MDVKVIAMEDSRGIDWEIDGKKPHQSRIEFTKDSGAHSVRFKLFDRTERGLRFDNTAPFWSHKSETDCPPRNSLSDQTSVAECTARELIITNKNEGEPCTIHYQLNFVDRDGRPEPVDPEFKNGGGGRT